MFEEVTDIYFSSTDMNILKEVAYDFLSVVVVTSDITFFSSFFFFTFVPSCFLIDSEASKVYSYTMRLKL